MSIAEKSFSFCPKFNFPEHKFVSLENKILEQVKTKRMDLKRTCEANATVENSSFIFTVCVKSVPLYHFKLAYVVLRMAVK